MVKNRGQANILLKACPLFVTITQSHQIIYDSKIKWLGSVEPRSYDIKLLLRNRLYQQLQLRLCYDLQLPLDQQRLGIVVPHGLHRRYQE